MSYMGDNMWQEILKNVEFEDNECCLNMAKSLLLTFQNSVFHEFTEFVTRNKNNCKVLVPEIEKILGEGMIVFKRKYYTRFQHGTDLGEMSARDEGDIYQALKDIYDMYMECNEDLTMLDVKEWA